MKETSQTQAEGHISLDETINLSDDEVVQEVASQKIETLATGTHMTPHKTPPIQTILEEMKQVEIEKEKSLEQIAQEMGLDTLITEVTNPAVIDITEKQDVNPKHPTGSPDKGQPAEEVKMVEPEGHASEISDEEENHFKHTNRWKTLEAHIIAT